MRSSPFSALTFSEIVRSIHTFGSWAAIDAEFLDSKGYKDDGETEDA